MSRVRLLLVLLVTALAVLALALPAQAASPLRYRAHLVGPGEVSAERNSGHYLDPGAQTSAEGEATLSLVKRGTELRFKVHVTDLTDAHSVALHLLTDFPDGTVNNEVIAVLWSGAMPGEFTGWLTKGVLTARQLEGPLTGQSLSDLIPYISEGRVYLVVHTRAYPKGEIGGQLVPAALFPGQ